MKNLLKLLISGGIAVAIASSIAIGIVVNKNKSTSGESTEPVVASESAPNIVNKSASSNKISDKSTNTMKNTEIPDFKVDPEIPGLSGGFNFGRKTPKYNLARQAILGM